jgi:hypothetical protein
MGFLDKLKEKLLPKEVPFPWDAQSVRHERFTMRLPEGWRFTRADWARAAAVGPGNQAVQFYYSVRTKNAPETPQDIERARPKMLELLGMLVKHDAQLNATPTQSVLPSGVLWTEASEVKGDQQEFVVYTTHLQPARVIQLSLRTSVPVSSGSMGAERLETLRGVLRSVEWT